MKERTEKQKQASRQNGSKSKGPKTPEGKKQSSKNALKHGAMAEKHQPPSEPPERLTEIETGLMKRMRPVGRGELEVVRSVAVDLLRLDRLDAAERAAMELAKLDHHVEPEHHEAHNEYVVLRLAWLRMKGFAEDVLATMRGDHETHDGGIIVEMASKQMERLGTLDSTVPDVGRILNISGFFQLTGKAGSKGNVELVVELATRVLEYLDTLASRRTQEAEARKRLEEELAALPDEKLIRRFDRYRQAIEKSMLRRIDILKGLRDLGVDVQLGGE